MPFGAQSTVVQSTYRPQLTPGAPGMVADEAGSEVGTRLVETAAGIGYGLAVSQGTGDKGAVIGGTKFIGISVRDVVQDRLPIDPLSGIEAGADIYPQRANMGVLSRGDIWVLAGANVAAGDGLFYETAGGTMSNSASGTAASGSLTFTSQPADGDTVTLNGTAITFKASGAVAASSQINLGPTLGDTLTALQNFINANPNADVQIAKFKATAYPPSPGGAGQGSGANQLMVSAVTVGVGGNSLTLAASNTSVTATSPLSGGSAAATAVAGGFWKSTALAGQLAKVSLGIQR